MPTHRGLVIYELVFDLTDGDLHHLSPPMEWFVEGRSSLFTQHLSGWMVGLLHALPLEH